MTWTRTFLNVSPSNNALKFIDKRLFHDDYRGSHHSQHNRYDMNTLVTILKLFDKYAPSKSLMSIRTTDLSKRTEVRPDEITYTKFCEECKAKTGRGTPDAMRKNFFPDLHRMQLIERYNKSKNKIDPYKRACIKYVSLSELGLRLIKSKNRLDRFFIYSRCLNELLGGIMENLLMILRNREYAINYIEIHEYMFFITAINKIDDFSIDTSTAISLIKEYRSLTATQKNFVIKTLKEDLDKSLSGISKLVKTQKRDFHNWLNESQQIYHLLKQTIYFSVNDDKLTLQNNDVNGEIAIQRSSSEKARYFEEHGLSKINGFELHHIIPLLISESAHHFKLLDSWKNMAYIDGYNHAKMTQNGNKNIIMEFEEHDLKLKDYSDATIYLKHNENIAYNTKKQQIMLDYNKELLGITARSS